MVRQMLNQRAIDNILRRVYKKKKDIFSKLKGLRQRNYIQITLGNFYSEMVLENAINFYCVLLNNKVKES